MSSVVRLRIELADRPGSLADVASVIGEHGGNITAVDVLQGQCDRVVDEITIEVPEYVDLTRLRSEIAILSDARVLSHQRARVVDPIVRVLRRAAEGADRVASDPFGALRQGVADMCATPAAWVLSAGDAVVYEAGRLALEEPGTVVVIRTDERLPPLGETVAGDACVLAVAGRCADEPCVAMVARAARQGFTPTECERVEALVALYQRISNR